MWIFFKILEKFIFGTLFNKDEYKLSSKRFNPFKVLVVIILYLHVVLFYLLLSKFYHLYMVIEKVCPQMLINVG